MGYETSVGFIVVQRNPRLQILLLKRTDTKIWDFPKGHFTTGELEEEVARRELYEETKMTEVTIFSDFRLEYTFINPQGSHRKIILFLGETSQEPIISTEHTSYRWCSAEVALDLVEFEEKKGAIRKALDFLSTTGS